jgi:hypothetical protein
MLALGREDYFCIRALEHSLWGQWRLMHEDVLLELGGPSQIMDRGSARTCQSFLACKL